MKFIRKLLLPALPALVLFLGGCSLLPSFRMFQRTINQKLAEKPLEQTEAERRGAKLIEVKSASLAPDLKRQVAEIHAIAIPLSASLGEPAQPVKVEDQAAVIAGLEDGIRAAQKKADAWKAFAKKYAGKTIDDTGIDLFEPSALLGVAGFVALCVFVPGFLSVVLFFFRRLRVAGQQMVEGIEQYKKDNPEQVAKLEATLRGPMDRASKNVVKKLKKLLPNETPSPAA